MPEFSLLRVLSLTAPFSCRYFHGNEGEHNSLQWNNERQSELVGSFKTVVEN